MAFDRSTATLEELELPVTQLQQALAMEAKSRGLSIKPITGSHRSAYAEKFIAAATKLVEV